MTAGNVEFSMSTGGVLVKFSNELLKFTTIIEWVVVGFRPTVVPSQ